jgi:3-methyladenine DNA glycosylase Tag
MEENMTWHLVDSMAETVETLLISIQIVSWNLLIMSEMENAMVVFTIRKPVGMMEAIVLNLIQIIQIVMSMNHSSLAMENVTVEHTMSKNVASTGEIASV